MQQQTRGQSLVEMALLLPLLLVVVFGIIDFGYFIYGYATIYHAARSASEVASGAPPFYSRIESGPPYDESDPCVRRIINAAQEPAVMFNDPSFRETNAVTISYPAYMLDPKTGHALDAEDRRQIGYPIEVEIEYDIEPLTPLWQLVPGLDWEDGLTVRTTARRSIEGYGRDPTAENWSACLP
jgi:hypothetical protein